MTSLASLPLVHLRWGSLWSIEVSDSTDRRQLNVPREVLDEVERLANSRDQKMTTILVAAISMYLTVTSRRIGSGKDMRITTADSFHEIGQLAALGQIPPFYLIATAVEAVAMTSRTGGSGPAGIFPDIVRTCPEGVPLSEHIAQLIAVGLKSSTTST